MWKRKGEQGTLQRHAMILILKKKTNKKIPPKNPTQKTVMRFLNIHIKNIHSRRFVPTYLFTWKKFTTQTPVTHKTAVCASDRLIYCFPLLRAGLDSVKPKHLGFPAGKQTSQVGFKHLLSIYRNNSHKPEGKEEK